MRLLIVEHEPEIALAIEGVAIAAGFEIAGIAKSMSEAVELGPEADIAIIDVRLGDGLTGPSVARALFAGFGLGVAYLTANPNHLKKEKGQISGAEPAGPEKIGEALSLAARNARARGFQDRSGQTI